MIERGFAALGFAGYGLVLWSMVTCKHPPKVGTLVILASAYAEITFGTTQSTELAMFFVVLCHGAAIPALLLYAEHATTTFKGFLPSEIGRYGAACVPLFEAMVFILFFGAATPAIACFFLSGLFVHRGYARGKLQEESTPFIDSPPSYFAFEKQNGITF